MHLYVHIPFCRKACHYCDFHFSVNLNNKSEVIKAISQEIILRKDFLENKKLKTIYFGGGTPSLLSEQDFEIIFESIETVYDLSELKEVTLETNPDDVNSANIDLWNLFGINRISLGIQTFDQAALTFMNRLHNKEQSINALNLLNKTFGNNLSVDLIYNRNAKIINEKEQHELLITDIKILSAFDFNHVSAYSLTIEEQTAFGKWEKDKKIDSITDSYAADQYDILTNGLHKLGFEQYEVSNFAKNKNYALHNSSYWLQKPYLGIGPAAHSFDGEHRFANISNNIKYLKEINAGIVPTQKEVLTNMDRANELILCGLRTMWGLDLGQLARMVILNSDFEAEVNYYLDKDWLIKNDNILTVSKEGRIFSDRIASDLFF